MAKSAPIGTVEVKATGAGVTSRVTKEGQPGASSRGSLKRKREEMVKRFGEEYTNLVEEANSKNRRALEEHLAETRKVTRKKKAPGAVEPAPKTTPKPKRARKSALPREVLDEKPVRVFLQRTSPNLPR